jgi:hypothetical protein
VVDADEGKEVVWMCDDSQIHAMPVGRDGGENLGGGVRQWKNALLTMREPNPDRQRVKQMLTLGGKLRAQAIADFQARFAPKPVRSSQQTEEKGQGV